VYPCGSASVVSLTDLSCARQADDVTDAELLARFNTDLDAIAMPFDSTDNDQNRVRKNLTKLTSKQKLDVRYIVSMTSETSTLDCCQSFSIRIFFSLPIYLYVQLVIKEAPELLAFCDEFEAEVGSICFEFAYSFKTLIHSFTRVPCFSDHNSHGMCTRKLNLRLKP
jgi:hypothetical protein